MYHTPYIILHIPYTIPRICALEWKKVVLPSGSSNFSRVSLQSPTRGRFRSHSSPWALDSLRDFSRSSSGGYVYVYVSKSVCMCRVLYVCIYIYIYI
ncbi:hypothetical protein EON63_12035 [archaeon]|nr:MAG: hypothetical protein EON63_12035 [archaeon]